MKKTLRQKIDSFEQHGFLQGLNIKINEQLFDVLGKLPGKNKSITMVREIERINTAARYKDIKRLSSRLLDSDTFARRLAKGLLRYGQ